MTLGAWVHTLNPVIVRLTDRIQVRWYGVAYLTGFIVAYFMLRWLARRHAARLPVERAPDAIFILIAGVVLGGRLGYVAFYRPELLWTFTNSPPWWGVLNVFEGGMASHGGILGCMAAGWVISRGWKDATGARILAAPWRHVMDYVALIGPVGLGIGRVANFINGELLGAVHTPPGQPAPWWTVKFPHELLERHAPELSPAQLDQLNAIASTFARPEDSTRFAAYERLIGAIQHGRTDLAQQLSPLLSARYPSQLFQALAEGVVLTLVLWWIARKPRLPGIVGCWFMITYGVLRIITEIWRLPDAHLASPRLMGLSRGQWLSVAMVALGTIVLAWIRRKGGEKMGGWARM